MRILFTGGGTGGHVFPLVAIIREIRKLYLKKDLEFFYIGPKDEFGSILLSQEDVRVMTISAGKIRRYFSFQNFIDILFKIPWSFFQSFYYLVKIDPQLIFSKGGFGSLPVTLCAKLLKMPIFLHESDVVPGLSNRIASKRAKRIFTSFPETEYFDLSKIILIGNPIRSEILGGSKEKAKELFNLTIEKPVFLFLGGSQGAEFINDFVLRILNTLLQDFEIIHLCGFANLKEVQAEAQVIINKDLEKYYHLYSFLDEEKLKNAYEVADFAVARAGSGTIFEIAATAVPSILVPLPSAAANHQAKNAYAYAETGAAIVMEQDNLTPNFFLEKIRYLFSRPETLVKMKEEALRFSKPLAAKTAARNILEYLMLE
ncbi:undecaprenyldiphospho-muramoylpentapeptide beta-N-acetylglucosaminyltransferase [Patescibacteria group bacterium]|nr:undecaprenyldiphospho-muramoylpentapeptide beta-N-acetylglucosaminyltransferase [Patescibacteria group bacterium]MBU4367764.1 undecaprenyldiphospho-muramoylpentapeptide beta-N-acetylglucosaminyltransferase [Patescibacteria group bacterium]MBU4461489.1 undecaprenyldiphospho-muramoylpentapeptide beta-N-acetylglucosaminyltransferase [Patescibacteria group bacterium]MCG2700321.1 undecaprenyldiphospho-muramoylpentapeptide beta-N-acetylglucosaminyltransferase [Candidatus Parcubacteria bacterium]